ncbi:translation initiation factor eIF 4e-like domain-containing protein [Xylariaceae sp. FL1019]|nr:translation initiation factor eIF 4e-like domain-containing protein [Xylariaceae sp. FL1019]
MAEEQVDLKTVPISPDGDKSEEPLPTDSEGKIVTVFHDKDNFNVLHPLQNRWTFWYTKPPSGKGDNWNELLKELYTVNSVEEFWGVFNNITNVSQLPMKSDYHLFKEGVRPEWEDPQNKHGGRWSYMIKDKRSVDIDKLWMYTCAIAIGENLEEAVGEDQGEVMGVVINVRKAFFRISVWTRTVGKAIPGGGNGDVAGGKGRPEDKAKEVLKGVGVNFKKLAIQQVVDLPDSEKAVEFTGHTDSAHSGSTRAKPKDMV